MLNILKKLLVKNTPTDTLLRENKRLRSEISRLKKISTAQDLLLQECTMDIIELEANANELPLKESYEKASAKVVSDAYLDLVLKLDDFEYVVERAFQILEGNRFVKEELRWPVEINNS